MADPDTKAAWKRRALRAEHELETLRKIRETEHRIELELARRKAVQSVALHEIEEALTSMREAIGGER